LWAGFAWEDPESSLALKREYVIGA
jgi:hypothetical protein